MLAPLAFVAFRVIKLSTLLFFMTELSISWIFSSKAIVISELMAIPVTESKGVKSRFGGVVSAAVKVIELALITLSE